MSAGRARTSPHGDGVSKGTSASSSGRRRLSRGQCGQGPRPHARFLGRVNFPIPDGHRDATEETKAHKA